ncbi:MAG: four helix bundle protein [Nitrospirota bacterium]|nr:four helix bundle protein [Nitrospirota bacterium]
MYGFKYVTVIANRSTKEEKYRLTDQLVRAARSVTANLAEGYGRCHYAENIQFARQARGSLYEVLDHLTTARDEGFIADDIFTQTREEVLKAVSVVRTSSHVSRVTVHE